MKLPSMKMVRNYVRSEGVRGYKTYTDVLKAVKLVKSGRKSVAAQSFNTLQDSIRNKQ